MSVGHVEWLVLAWCMWHPPPVSFSWPIFIGRSLRSVNPEISLVRSLGKTCLWTLPHAFLEPIHMQVPGVNLQTNLLTNGRNQRLFLTSTRVARSKTLVASKKTWGTCQIKGKDGHLRFPLTLMLRNPSPCPRQLLRVGINMGGLDTWSPSEPVAEILHWSTGCNHRESQMLEIDQTVVAMPFKNSENSCYALRNVFGYSRKTMKSLYYPILDKPGLWERNFSCNIIAIPYALLLTGDW